MRKMGTWYPIHCIAAMQTGTYVPGILDALGPCVITHLGDAPRCCLPEAARNGCQVRK